MSGRGSAAAAPAWALVFGGTVSYARGLRLQESVHRARVAGLLPDVLLLLQHEPVVTLGRRGRTRHLLVVPGALAARGIALHTASRGGDVTFHGPGQWVLYPILRLGGPAAGAHGYLHDLEEIALRTAADFGVKAFRREGLSGAWSEGGKFAAIGFHLKRWVSLHGMSVNVDVDLAGFASIVPCGLEGQPVASFRSLLGDACPSREAVRESLLRHFGRVMRRDLSVFPADGPLPAPLREAVDAAGRGGDAPADALLR